MKQVQIRKIKAKFCTKIKHSIKKDLEKCTRFKNIKRFERQDSNMIVVEDCENFVSFFQVPMKFLTNGETLWCQVCKTQFLIVTRAMDCDSYIKDFHYSAPLGRKKADIKEVEMLSANYRHKTESLFKALELCFVETSTQEYTRLQ